MARRSTRRKRRGNIILKTLKSRVFWLFLLGVGILSGVCYLLFLSEVFQIEEIVVSGNEKVKEQSILEIVQPQIEKEFRLGPFFSFSTRSIFIARPPLLEQKIKKAFPRVGVVTVKRNLPDSLELKVGERRPFVEICVNSGECYRADEKGVVFEKSAGIKQESEEEVEVFQVKSEDLIIVVEGPSEFELGKEAILPLYLAGTAQIKNRIASSALMEPVELSLNGKQLVVATDKGFKIYFDLDKDVEDQLFNLEMVVEKKISEEEMEGLEYIDLRFGNRVYYK